MSKQSKKDTSDPAKAEAAVAEQEAVPTDEPTEPIEPIDDEREGGDGIVFIEPDAAYVEALEENQRLEARLRTVSAAYKQLQEDMEQSRLRMERQGAHLKEVQRGEVVAKLFEPLENLRRSIAAIHEDASVSEDAKQGLSHVSKQFLAAFAALGLEEVSGVGADFDPNLHEAIGMVPVDDEAADGKIVEVFSTGYRIGTRLVQPARVLIGKVEEPKGES